MPRRTALVTALIALAALTSGPRLTGQANPPAGGPGASAQTDPQFSDIDKLCDARNQALRKMGDGADKGLDDLAALIDSAEKEAVKEPALATAGTSTPPAKVVEEVRTARESVKLNLTLGKQAQAEAAREVQLARQATNPVEKLKHYDAARGKAEHAESLMQKVARDLSPYTPATRPHTVNSEALDKLRAMTTALANGGSSGARLATLRDGFDGGAERLRAEVVRRPQTEFFTGAPRGYANGTLTLGTGRRVDVSALERASAPPPGQAAPRRPLFREVPSPTGSSYVIDAAAANRARAAAATPQVGGVALQVTLLALGAAGVPGFESAGELEGVDETVMISLQRLFRRLQPLAADATRWAAMPDDLRHPGGIERIIGYVVDPARGDVIVLGTPASRPQARLDVDALVLGLRASWRDDTPPFVSLDPSPLQPDGDQLSRIGGVPEDSIMAKVMLDADYMMKGMMLGARPTGLASYKSLVQLMQENPATLTRPWHARFWFYPKPLGAAAVQLSASGRTLVFNAELQVLTEQMATQGAAFVNDTGTSVEEMAAQQFSRSLDALATGAADSSALLARLRGMTGAVTLGTLLRKNGVTYQVLRDFSGLPYRRLSAGDAAPRAYARLSTDYDAQVNGRRVRMSIGGGVSLVPRPHRSTRAGGVDLLASKIEARIDAGALQNADAVREPTPTVFTRTTSSSTDQRLDAALVRGSNAFRRGQFDVASREFRTATDLDPSSVDAYLNLAFSFDRMGRPAEARTAIRTARLLDPDDTGVQLVETAIGVHANRAAGAGLDRKARRDLIRLYSLHARSALHENDTVAESWANEAIGLEETLVPADAYLTRGFARFKRTPDAACEDLKKAWDATEYVGLSGVAFDDDQKIYAFASLGMSSCAVIRNQRALATGTPGPTLFRRLAADLKQAADLLQPAEKMFPTFALVFSAALRVEGLRYMMLDLEFTPEGRRSEQTRLTALATDLIQRFPLASESYSTAGAMYLDFKATDRAIATCTRGLAVRPNDLDCLTVRMTALSLAGRCAEARADAATAQANVQFASLPTEFTTRCGRP